MTSFTVTPEQLSKVLANHAKKLPIAFQKGSLKAAHRTRAFLVRNSPVDTGTFKNSWVVVGNGNGVNGGSRVHNFSPIAGIIELGARPHKVNRAGIEALTLWARRKILTGMTRKAYVASGRKPPKTKKGRSWKDVEAENIAWAIAKKLEKVGQKGTYLVQNNIWVFHGYLEIEVAREVAKILQSKYGGH